MLEYKWGSKVSLSVLSLMFKIKLTQVSSSFWTSVLIGEMVILWFTLAFISFLLLHNKLPQTQWLKTTALCCCTCSVGQRPGQVICTGLQKAEVKLWGRWCFHLDTLGEESLPSSLRLLAVISLQLKMRILVFLLVVHWRSPWATRAALTVWLAHGTFSSTTTCFFKASRTISLLWAKIKS